MATLPAQHKAREHLSNIHIAMILALDKVLISQRKIAALIKTSRTAVLRALQT
jgi:biotin operon repressor